MKLIAQIDNMGCSIACVASLLGISYPNAIRLFDNGKEKAGSKGFFCKDIIEALLKCGIESNYSYIKCKIKNDIYRQGSIVFIKRSIRYPQGHYLLRGKEKWMDPWINFPNPIKEAGFRRRLPGKPIYLIRTFIE